VSKSVFPAEVSVWHLTNVTIEKMYLVRVYLHRILNDFVTKTPEH